MRYRFPILAGLALATVSSSAGAQAPSRIRIPLSFELRPDGTVTARGPGYAATIRSDGALIRVIEADRIAEATWRLVGAAARPPVVSDPVPGRTHYLIGDDEEGWLRNVRRMGKVLQEDVYSGIDLIWRGDPTRLEYDFEVAPGADPSEIRFLWEGEVDRLHQKPPVAWEIAGEGRIHRDVSLVAHPDGTTGFDVPDWSGRHPLVIDPVIAYGSFLGGADNEAIAAMTRDGQGNFYLTGRTASANLPAPGSPNGSLQGIWDLFVVKLDPTAQNLIYTTYIGANDVYGQDEFAHDIAVDGQGRAVVLGRTEIAGFPTTNAVQPNHVGGVDAVLFKLDASGSNLVFSTYLGGSGHDLDRDNSLGGAGRLAILPNDDTVVCGGTWSSDFPTRNASQPALAGNQDLFLTRFDGQGQMVWSTYLGFSDEDEVEDMILSPVGHLILAGASLGSNWPVMQGAAFPTGLGFVTGFDPASQRTLWSTRFPVVPITVAANPAGDVWIAGGTSGGRVPTTSGAYRTEHGGSYNGHTLQGWVARLGAFGTRLVFGSYYGASASNEVFGKVVVDDHDHAYCVGSTSSHTGSITSHGLVVKFDPLGFEVVYSDVLAGDDTGLGSALLEGNGSLWAAGSAWATLGAQTPATVTPGAAQTIHGGQQDGYLVRIEDLAGSLKSVKSAATRYLGGSAQDVEVVFDGALATGGTVQLTSSNPSLLQPPTSVNVPPGSASASFPVTLGRPLGEVPVTLTATHRSVSRSLTLIVWPGPRWFIEGFPVQGQFGSDSSGEAINAHGHIVGGSGAGRFFVVDGAGFRTLGTGSATGISDDGAICGSTNLAFRYTPGTGVQTLGSLGTTGSSWALGINRLGEVVGGSDATWPGGIVGTAGFLSVPGNPLQNLGSLGGDGSEAWAIDRYGRITGRATLPGAQVHAFRYDNGTMLDLGVLPGHVFSIGMGINDLGDVTGRSFSSGYGTSSIFHYSNAAGMVDLGLPAGMSHGAGLDVDVAGRAVGWAGTANSPLSGNAVLFDGQAWRVLEDELSAEDAFRWDLHVASGLNDRGQIVGTGSDQDNSGRSTAFRMTPAFFRPYGEGTKGTDDIVTALRGVGIPITGQTVQLVVRGAPGTLAVVVISATSGRSNLPGGGTLLLGNPIYTLGIFASDPRGLATASLALPAGLPPGSYFAQAGTLDPNGPNGQFTTSNGIELVVPY